MERKILTLLTISLLTFNMCFYTVSYSESINLVQTWSPISSNEESNVSSDLTNSPSSSLFASANTECNNPLNLTSGGAILIDQNSGEVLYNYNMHEKLRPASVTKVMTILLIMEALDSGKISLTDKIPCSENASKMGGSQIWLDTKEELTVDEMLKAICVVSANDCTVQNQQEKMSMLF